MLIRSIVIYLMDSTIQLLNNSGASYIPFQQTCIRDLTTCIIQWIELSTMDLLINFGLFKEISRLLLK